MPREKGASLCRPREWDLGKNSCVAMRWRVDVGWHPVEITLFKSALLSIKVETKEQAQVSTVQARPLHYRNACKTKTCPAYPFYAA